MRAPSQPEKLIVLAADRDIEEVITAALNRHQSLGTRLIPFACQRHPNRDAGCRANAADFLRSRMGGYSHALVVFDREGCGSSESRGAIEEQVESELSKSGWESRGKAIVIDPELEEWLCSDSSAVLKVLGWRGGYAELRCWLQDAGFWDRSAAKPHQPKAALDRTLRSTRKRRTPRLYGEIAASVSLARCENAAFRKLKRILQLWFPRETDARSVRTREHRTPSAPR